MKLVLCALLLVSGFQEARFTPCGSLPSSGLPNLSTDTSGALPPDQRSKRLQKLFHEASRATRLRIRFTQLPAGVPNTSGVLTTREEQVVALRQNLNHELEENAIAHELSHILLQGKGFAAMVHTPDGAPPLMMELGFAITSCVDDAVIDRQMSKLGFNPELLNHDSAEQMRLNPPNFSVDRFNDPIFRDGSALIIVCFSFRKKLRGDEIETSWQKLSAEVVAHAHSLALQIADIRCEDAQTCLERKKHIRDILGYPITFCNPLTQKYE